MAFTARALATLLAAWVQAGSPSQPAPSRPAEHRVALTRARLQEVDLALVQAEQALREAEAAPRSGGLGGAVPARRPASQKAGPGDSADFYSHWYLYSLCRALATRDVSACRDAGSPAVARGCPSTYELERVRAAFIAGAPEAQALCREGLVRSGTVKPPSAGPVCRAWGSGDVELFGRAIMDAREGRLSAARAQLKARELLAQPQSCPRLEHEPERRLCEEQAAYRRALAAKDAGVCGAGGICRALMGQGPGVCEVYSRGVRVLAVLDMAERVIASTDVGPADLALLKEFDVRVDRLYALRERAYAPAPASAPRARAP